jgi:hypothetical protein
LSNTIIRRLLSRELISVISIKPRNDLLDTDQFTGTPHKPQEILVIELSTISSFFSGVLILFPPAWQSSDSSPPGFIILFGKSGCSPGQVLASSGDENNGFQNWQLGLIRPILD